MKSLMSLVVVLLFAMSVGTNVARADGGETGASASHTQPFWGYSNDRNLARNWNYARF
jgi:hypothetical protein